MKNDLEEVEKYVEIVKKELSKCLKENDCKNAFYLDRDALVGVYENFLKTMILENIEIEYNKTGEVFFIKLPKALSHISIFKQDLDEFL